MKRGKSGVVIAVILAATMLFTFTLVACGETSHKHSLTHVDDEESTCTLQGNIEYWECTSCGKYFKDADATIEATWEELRLPMLEHDYDPATHCCKNCGSYDNEGAQNGLTYALNEQKNGYVVTDCGGSTTVAEISAEINGLPVVGIKGGAFENRSNLTSITIPDSVTSIGGYAFSGCSGLTSVTIGNGVTSIDFYAFYGCSGLTNITIPDSVTSIGNHAFYGCSGLTSITIPGSVTSIRQSAFNGCSDLTSITIPFVGDKADGTGAATHFGYIFGASRYSYNNDYVPKSLKEVIITGGTSIGWRAFWGCSGLTSITIPDSVTSIDQYAFDGCNGIIEIENGVSYVDGWVIDCDSSITSVELRDGTRGIASYAFSGCSGLTSITIPDSVTSIGDYAFYECSGLTSITIPDSVTSIGGSAFEDCSGLTSVTIPDSVTSIGWSAFSGCSGLTSVTIGNGVTSIGYSAFRGCSGLTSVTIGNGVTSIGDWAFNGCSSLQEIIVAEGNPVYHSAGNCIIETESKTLIAGCKSSVIPDDGSVTSIGNGAFRGCSGLTSIVIPDSVTSIGYEAFYGCSGLTSITIPGSVTSIGDWAFYACYKLVEVYNKSALDIVADNPEHGNIGRYAKNVYTEEGGSQFTDTDDGYRFFFDGENGYLMGYYGTNSEITLPSSFTAYDRTVVGEYEIHEYALYGCDNLTTITISDSITSIGNYAFGGVTAEIVWGDDPQITSIGGFRGYQGKNLTIPDSVTSIGNYAFYGCSGLTSITIPDSVTSIGDGAFDGCSGLTSVTIPDSVTSIDSWAFSGCSGLTSIVVEDGNPVYHSDGNCLIETGSKTLIVGCKSSVIPHDGSVTSIGWSAFSGCSGLTSVTIPDSVTSIGDWAFDGCRGLTAINFQGTMAQWQAIEKGSNWDDLTGEYAVICTDGTISKAGA